MADHFSEEVEAILSKPTASVDEFRLVIGCGRNQAYQFIREGRIRTVRIGTRIRIPTAAIRSMLEGDAAPPIPDEEAMVGRDPSIHNKPAWKA